MKARSCMSSLIFFWDSVTCLVDVGKAVFGVSLNFSKDLDTISHSILLEKLAVHGLDGYSLCWLKQWLGPESGSDWS